MGGLRTLYLHVGQLKTGSSFLQSAFALSADSLAGHGICYPTDYPGHAAACRGEATIGNGVPLIGRIGGQDTGLQLPLDGDVLFSCERLHKYLSGPKAAALFGLAGRRGFGRVSCLLMVRDPVEHAASSARHALAHGLAGSVEEAFEAFHAPLAAAGFLARMTVRGGRRPEIIVRNYSRARGPLLSVAAGWLGVPAGALADPPLPIVNPSSGALTYPGVECQRAMLARMDAAIAGVDRWLPEGERYRLDVHEPTDGGAG